MSNQAATTTTMTMTIAMMRPTMKPLGVGAESRRATTNGESEVVVPQTLEFASSTEVVTSFHWGGSSALSQCSSRTRLESGLAPGSYRTQTVIAPVCVAVVEIS